MSRHCSIERRRISRRRHVAVSYMATTSRHCCLSWRTMQRVQDSSSSVVFASNCVAATRRKIIIITRLTGALISVFPNQFKAPQGRSFEACCQWASLIVQIITVLFTFTVQKYIYPFVIVCSRILKMQVIRPYPKSGEQIGIPGEKPLTSSLKIGTTY